MSTLTTWNTISLTCPYCLEQLDDETEFINLTKQAVCPYCENQFEFEKIQFTRYMSHKIPCREHAFKILRQPHMPNPYIRENICFTIYTCAKCGKSDIATAPAEPGDVPFIVPRDL